MNPLDLACQAVIERHALGTVPGLSPLQNLLLTFDLNPTLDEELFPSVSLTHRLQRFGLTPGDAEALTAALRETDPLSLTQSVLLHGPDTEMLESLNPTDAVEYLIPPLLRATPIKTNKNQQI